MKTRNFKKAYDVLPPKIRKNIQERLIENVFMVKNPQTFYNKKNGKEKITDYEWMKIVEIFAEYGVNAETGELWQTQTL